MQESYGKGVAIHAGPELCVASREAGCEAVVGAPAGRVLSPEITQAGVPTRSPYAEGHILSIDTQDGQEPHGVGRPRACRETPRARTGRSQAFPLARLATGRSGKSADARR